MLPKKLRLGPSVLSRRGMCTFPAALLIALGAAAAFSGPLAAHGQERESAAKLVAHTMANPEFRAKTFRGGEWLGNGDFYLDLEPSATAGGTDIVRYPTA